MDHDSDVTGLVIGCAIEVHKALGPGLKEKAYDIALREALNRRSIKYVTQPRLAAFFEGVNVGNYQPDLIVENTVIVEIKVAHRLAPVFTSQMLSYLKITSLRVGLILNFQCAKMADGIKRVVL